MSPLLAVARLGRLLSRFVVVQLTARFVRAVARVGGQNTALFSLRRVVRYVDGV